MRITNSVLWLGFSFATLSNLAAQSTTNLAPTNSALSPSATPSAQPEFYTDPSTGIVYRKVIRTIQTPVVETKMTPAEQTVYVPQTVVESRPEVRRTYVPVTQYHLTPTIEGRWNPFVEPRVAYEHVPQTTWHARDEVVQQTQTRVQWKTETKTTQVAQQVTRFDSQQKIDYEPVGRVAVPPASGLDPQIAARLRPIASGTAIAPVSTPSNMAVASPSGRNSLQTGLRPTDLSPTSPLQMPTGNIAELPSTSFWR